MVLFYNFFFHFFLTNQMINNYQPNIPMIENSMQEPLLNSYYNPKVYIKNQFLDSRYNLSIAESERELKESLKKIGKDDFKKNNNEDLTSKKSIDESNLTNTLLKDPHMNIKDNINGAGKKILEENEIMSQIKSKRLYNVNNNDLNARVYKRNIPRIKRNVVVDVILENTFMLEKKIINMNDILYVRFQHIVKLNNDIQIKFTEFMECYHEFMKDILSIIEKTNHIKEIYCKFFELSKENKKGCSRFNSTSFKELTKVSMDNIKNIKQFERNKFQVRSKIRNNIILGYNNSASNVAYYNEVSVFYQELIVLLNILYENTNRYKNIQEFVILNTKKLKEVKTMHLTLLQKCTEVEKFVKKLKRIKNKKGIKKAQEDKKTAEDIENDKMMKNIFKENKSISKKTMKIFYDNEYNYEYKLVNFDTMNLISYEAKILSNETENLQMWFKQYVLNLGKRELDIEKAKIFFFDETINLMNNRSNEDSESRKALFQSSMLIFNDMYIDFTENTYLMMGSLYNLVLHVVNTRLEYLKANLLAESKKIDVVTESKKIKEVEEFRKIDHLEKSIKMNKQENEMNEKHYKNHSNNQLDNNIHIILLTADYIKKLIDLFENDADLTIQKQTTNPRRKKYKKRKKERNN